MRQLHNVVGGARNLTSFTMHTTRKLMDRQSFGSSYRNFHHQTRLCACQPIFLGWGNIIHWTFQHLPDLACEAGVWWWLLPLLVEPGLSGVCRGGEPNSDRWYDGVSPPRPGGNHISSNGTLPLDSTSPGVDWLRPMAAAISIVILITNHQFSLA